MAAVLARFLRDGGVENVVCESAGILDVAASGGPASPFVVKAADRIGIDLSEHAKRQIGPSRLSIEGYDLFVCVDEEVAARILELGVDIRKICNAQVSNPWPSQFQEDHDRTFEIILAAMFRMVTRYF